MELGRPLEVWYFIKHKKENILIVMTGVTKGVGDTVGYLLELHIDRTNISLKTKGATGTGVYCTIRVSIPVVNDFPVEDTTKGIGGNKQDGQNPLGL